MRIFWKTDAAAKRAAKTLARLADVKLSLAQEAISRIAGYENWHELSRGHDEQPPSPSDADLGETEAGIRRAVLARRLASLLDVNPDRALAWIGEMRLTGMTAGETAGEAELAALAPGELLDRLIRQANIERLPFIDFAPGGVVRIGTSVEMRRVTRLDDSAFAAVLAEMRGRIDDMREFDGKPFGTMRGTGVTMRFWKDGGRNGAHVEMPGTLRAMPRSEGPIDLHRLHLYGPDRYGWNWTPERAAAAVLRIPSDPFARLDGRALLVRLAALGAVEKWRSIQILTDGRDHRVQAILSTDSHEIARLSENHAHDLLDSIRRDMTVTSHSASKDWFRSGPLRSMAPFGASARVWKHDAGLNAAIEFPANAPLERKSLDLRDYAISRFKGPAQARD